MVYIKFTVCVQQLFNQKQNVLHQRTKLYVYKIV